MSAPALVAVLVPLWVAVAVGLWRLIGDLERVERILTSRGPAGAARGPDGG
ncbi:MAG: hypothetical protein QN183_08890 [Armatimonadota bacterium]|nr:hypothetical protein [Armatimonadota bacterium]MDR7533347.1 hypothetical protein [Armatimonadota bacterium]MDR7536467.1 hypothetical protein [Armatimonadota bacterium]